MRRHGWFYWTCMVGMVALFAWKMPGTFLYVLGIGLAAVALMAVLGVEDPSGRTIYDYLGIVKRDTGALEQLGTVDRMNGVQFERWCGRLLKAMGCSSVQYTKASGDQGVDILAVYNGERYAIQCKRFQGSVGTSAVQEVVSGRAVYGCHRCAVMTNSTFTNGAIRAAQANNVQLIDRNVLLLWLNRVNNGQLAQESLSTQDDREEWWDLFDYLSATEDD